MKSARENPDSEENERLSQDNERAVFAAQMQAKQDARSPLLKEMDGLLASAVTQGCCYQTVALLKEAIMHQQLSEDIAKEL